MIRTHRYQVAFATIAIAVCISMTGCIGGLAQLLYIIKGHEIPAEYSEFDQKRVAVVITTDSSAYGPDPLAETIGKYINLKLATNIDTIDLVPKMEIDNWIDVNGFDETELEALGKGVDADYVLSVNVDGYSIREGRTIYKGRSDVTIVVSETETGKTTYSKGPTHMEFPENGRPAIQTDDRKFETFYLAWLTQKIARQFYKHDKMSDFAEDAMLGY